MNYLKPLFSVLNIFLITPWYDFQKNEFYNLTISKVYGVFIILVKVFWIGCLTMSETVKRNFHNFLFSVKILYILAILTFLTRTVLTICKSTLWQIDDWKALIGNFQKIDERLCSRDSEMEIGRKFYFSLAIKHGVFVAYATYEGYAWMSYLKLTVSQTVLMSPIFDYYLEFLLIILINAFIQSVRHRYENLTKELRIVSENGQLVQEFKTLSEAYRLLSENIEICGRIFGCQFILTLFSWAIEIILCLNYMFMIIVYVTDSQLKKLLICDVSTMVFVTYNFLTIILSTESVAQERAKFIDLCHQLQQEYGEGSKEIKILENMVKFSRNFRRDFTANGFFRINKGIVFGLIGNVATYYIITIQFNESQYLKTDKNVTLL